MGRVTGETVKPACSGVDKIRGILAAYERMGRLAPVLLLDIAGKADVLRPIFNRAAVPA
jgi:hypothetical protein